MALLSLVPTPIGNLSDITLRALETLKRADVVAAEDTRHSGKLLKHFGIDKRLERLDAHTIRERGPGVLAAYDHIAYVTDAGTPGISDPGAELVKLALERGDEVEVLPGPTALIPALVVSGLPPQPFAFEGFLPRKGQARRERLEYLAASRYTTVIYESAKRLSATLAELAAVCGQTRRISVSRELSKRFETTYRGGVEQVIESLPSEGVRGEVVIVVGPFEGPSSPKDADAIAADLRRQGLGGRELRRALVERGVPRNRAYDLSLVDIAKEKD